MNNKGSSVFAMFLFIFIVLFLAIFIGLGLWGFNLVNDIFDQNIMVGQVNLSEINNQTFGQINKGFEDNADNIGIMLILGMCLLMILNGYFIGSQYPKLFLIIDIFILVFIFIAAVYISQVYEIFINSSDLFSSIYADDLPNSSKFVLNLPLIIGTLGAIIMVVSYSGIRRKEKREEEVSVYGY